LPSPACPEADAAFVALGLRAFFTFTAFCLPLAAVPGASAAMRSFSAAAAARKGAFSPSSVSFHIAPSSLPTSPKPMPARTHDETGIGTVRRNP
jgi:hypothetical protein